MERVLNAQPISEKIKAQLTLEINSEHPIAAKLAELYESDKEKVEKYAKLLYSSACLISGIAVDDPSFLIDFICENKERKIKQFIR